MKPAFYILLLTLLFCQCRQDKKSTATQIPGKLILPGLIKEEHDTLLAQVGRISLYTDSTGSKARELEELLKYHFSLEEEQILAPLGLLPSITTGALPDSIKGMILSAGKLKSQLDLMTAEHQMVNALLDELLLAATPEQQPGILLFKQALQKHARLEEEVLFPTTILIAAYLQAKHP